MSIHHIAFTHDLHRRLFRIFLIALTALLSAGPALARNPAGIRSIEAEIERLKTEIEPLPRLLPNPVPWTLGYRSGTLEQADQTVTIDIRFITPAPIDMIALIPAAYAPNAGTLATFGFPEQFTIERLLQGEPAGLLVDYSREVYVPSGIHPQLFELPEAVFADGIRITVLRSSLHKEEFMTALSEVMVFSEGWNVALGAEVAPSSHHFFGYVWNRYCLVDGFCLFYPVTGHLQNRFNNFNYADDKLTLIFDLGEEQEIDELRIWPAAVSLEHNFPQAAGIHFPTQIRFERLDSSQASTGDLILETDNKNIRPGSGPLMLRFPAISGRHFSLKFTEPVPEFRFRKTLRISLSEIEIFSRGRVLSGGSRPIIRSEGLRVSKKRRDAVRLLTDSLTSEGEILPLRTWIEGLNRRVDLERQLEALQLKLHVAHQQERERLLFLILLFICLTPIVAWLVKLVADRHWKRVRDRMACDLHDEIGANVSSLAHMTELLKETIPTPSSAQIRILKQAIYTARLTAGETRNFIQLLEAEKSGFDLTRHIHKAARQILEGLDYRCDITASAALARLKPFRKWDLLLFVKEALNNIIKHAAASRVEIQICRNHRRIQLSISDDGKGLPPEGRTPRHLEIRAKRLNGSLKIESMPEQGTRILLNFK